MMNTKGSTLTVVDTVEDERAWLWFAEFVVTVVDIECVWEAPPFAVVNECVWSPEFPPVVYPCVCDAPEAFVPCVWEAPDAFVL